MQKQPVAERRRCVAEHGVEGDAHAGPWHRQVSLLANESIEKMRASGADVGPAPSARTSRPRASSCTDLPVGARLRVGAGAAEVTQIGKVCHDRCAIFDQAGDCVMPREGIFVARPRGRRGQGRRRDRRSRSARLIHAAVLTVSDKGSRGEREDESGAALEEALRELGVAAVERAIVPDEQDQIARRARRAGPTRRR